MKDSLRMFRSFVLALLFCGCLPELRGQVLLDDCDGVGDQAYATEGAWAREPGGNTYTCGTAAATTPEHSYASCDLSQSITGWDLRNANSNCWFGWMDLNRAAVGGWGAGHYSCGMVLAADEADFNAGSADGYAVGFRGDGALVVFKFPAGIVSGATALPAASTEIVDSGYAYADADNGVNFFVELLPDGKWKVFFKAGAQLAWWAAVNKASYDGGCAISAAAETSCRGAAYKYAGWIYAHSSGAGEMSHFDNLGAGQLTDESDIAPAAGFVEPANVAYADCQAADIVMDGHSLEMARFALRDGGSDLVDADASATTLRSIAFSIAGHANLRRVALYDDFGNEMGEVDAAETVTFGGLSLAAADDGSRSFSVRVSFHSAVTDNAQIQFTVLGAVADLGGSLFTVFTAASGLGGDANRIEATATRLEFSNVPAAVSVGQNFALTVAAKDANGTLDLDSIETVALKRGGTGGGFLRAAGGLTQSLAGGLRTWSDLQYADLAEDFTVLADSALADVETPTITAELVSVFLSEIADPGPAGSGNDVYRFIELHNGGAAPVDLAAEDWWLGINYNGVSWQYIQLTNTIPAGGTHCVARSRTDFFAAYGFYPAQADAMVSMNGDDGCFIYKGGRLVDAYGVPGEDGSGRPWEYTDAHAVRARGVSRPNNVWAAEEWSIQAATPGGMTPGRHGGGTLFLFR